MVSMVITFAIITALFEALMLWTFVSVRILRKPWFSVFIHCIVAGANLAVHWGTIVGTMTAITAALVSFMVYPMVLWLKVFIDEFRNRQRDTRVAQRCPVNSQ